MAEATVCGRRSDLQIKHAPLTAGAGRPLGELRRPLGRTSVEPSKTDEEAQVRSPTFSRRIAVWTAVHQLQSVGP